MDTSFHYLLMAAQGLFQRKVMAQLSEAGLTAGQPKVLDYLGLHNGSVQKAIAAGCQIDPATLTGILNRMEEKGLIRRTADENDQRQKQVTATEKGRELNSLVQAAFQEAEAVMVKGWEKQKLVRQTLETLTRDVLSDMMAEEQAALLDGLKKLCEKMCNTEGLQ